MRRNTTALENVLLSFAMLSVVLVSALTTYYILTFDHSNRVIVNLVSKLWYG